MEKYNTKLSQLAGLFTHSASEIVNDDSLLKGQKFLILQRLIADITPTLKAFEEVKKEIEDFAKNQLIDNGNGKSEETNFEGASVFIKYVYSKPKLNAEKLSESLQQAFAEIGTKFNEKEFLKETTPKKTVVIQSILDK